MGSSKKSGIDYLMEDYIPSGGDPALMMGTGPYSDRYITASDSAFGSYSSTATGKADKRYNGTESGTYLPTGANWRQDQLARDVSNPYYQEVARKIGINQLSSANDMGQVFAYLDQQNAAPAPAPAAAAPTPAPEAPKPPAFNLADYTDSSSPDERSNGFMGQFVADVNSRTIQTPPATNMTPTLYEKFAADYEKQQQERQNTFAADAAVQVAQPAPPAPEQKTEQPTQSEPAPMAAPTAPEAQPYSTASYSPAGQYARDTLERQDSHSSDRAQRAVTGSEPESTRFAGGTAFGTTMGRAYEQLNRTYDMLSGRKRA